MVEGRRKENLVAEMSVREHKVHAGLAEKLGGKDEAPDPHELLESALAACTILTVQLYANRKGYKLESTDVKVKIESEGPETQISREITFRGELTDEEKARLYDIAGRCPIHRLLESKVTITSKMV
ncbi:OsmC family protein [Bdellovibrio bacteriovorus]|uniref:OsmC family protein n=1 Tax=Bdellovibrio bacteriovorus TaxID=959 RepID=UPI0035A6AA77